MNITQMSLMASALIAAAVIIRAIFMGKLPKWSFQALWGIVLARLLIPFTVESPLSVYRAVDRVQSAWTPAPLTTANTAYPGPIEVISAQPIQAAAETVRGSRSANVWFILWIAVAALLAAYFLFTHLRARRLYRCARTISALRVNRFRVAVRASSRVSAPFTYGVFRPVVLMPKHMNLNEKEFNYVLMHELMHVRHFDALKKWLLVFALCIHWFNPLVWVMYILANRDIELLCDESVVRSFGHGARTSYATMLIDLMERQSTPLVPLASYFSKNATEERILSIMKYKKISLASVLLAVILVLATATALATNAPTAARQPVIINASEDPQPVEDSTPIEPLQPIKEASVPLTAVSSEQSPVNAQEAIKAYAPYAQYGLTYDVDTGRLYYRGELVRYFEDMYSVGKGMSAGMLSQHTDGTVDVRGVRKFPETIARNPDGSYDPSGELVGVEPYPQDEFDARTKELSSPAPVSDASDNNPVAASENATGVDVGDAVEYTLNVTAQDDEMIEVSIVELEYWTAEEYEAWLNVQRANFPEKIGGWWYYKLSDGWVYWTQERVDAVLAAYEQTLKDIQNGLKVSVSAEVSLEFEAAKKLGFGEAKKGESAYDEAMIEINAIEATDAETAHDEAMSGLIADEVMGE